MKLPTARMAELEAKDRQKDKLIEEMQQQISALIRQRNTPEKDSIAENSSSSSSVRTKQVRPTQKELKERTMRWFAALTPETKKGLDADGGQVWRTLWKGAPPLRPVRITYLR